MDIVLGLLFWGGLLALTLLWISRTGLTGSRRHHQRHLTPDAEHRVREDEALADGLVIGHFLTRDHYRRELTERDEALDQAAAEQQSWEELAATGDEVYDDLDHAEFDAMGGFGVEPWADELFDHDLDDEP